ncbi:SH3 domain-containing protein [Massilia sp. DJPM01]|uniref:SH3 domain-containing protein n=1 Tax=Massilia sp. DJPM01 TaxID=3024404 RepID=UPI00259FC3DA|nr:SH3 domain-containing protein [Massilia sp. DJPM01]MDM5175953.1 SH3 domain-containing protein [Massilia sp. DJPM01]
MTIPRFLFSAAFVLASAAAHALDFKTIGAPSVILYDAPSVKGGKLFIALRGMPVEVVLTYGEWVRVRDANGDLAWAEAKSLSARRNVVVRTANAKVRGGADSDASLLMTADKGVLLELIDAQTSSWIKVKHRDGITGYIRATDVWGI